MAANLYPEIAADPDNAVANEPSSEMKPRLRHLMESGKVRLNEWKDGFETGVRERPIQSLLIAAAVGAAIGLLIGRRSSR